jgi:transcriptional regulator with XRE-family HTH domain
MPMEDFDRVLGERLRAARKLRGWSLHDVEANSQEEFKASVLGAYERGERTISVNRLYRLAELYEIGPAHLLPTHSELQAGPEGEVVLDLAAVEEADMAVAEAIERYLTGIQLRRRQAEPSMVVRQSDLELLSSLVEADQGTIRQVLAEWRRRDGT